MRRTFATLDGLRGAAAVIVVAFHAATAITPELPVFGSAYLAVDLFFLLSGFVIGYAYDEKLTGGMGFRRFMRVRIIRLYPLYFLGLILAVATPVALALATREWWLAKQTAVTLPWAVFMLPRPVADPAYRFIINPPAWSLFFEVIGNILYALLISRLDKRALMGIVAVAGVVLTIVSLRYGTINTGPSWQTWSLICFARMAFSFTLGLLLYRWWREGVLPAPKLPASVAILLFLVLIALPSSGPVAGALTAAVVIIGFPLVVIAAIANEPAGRTASVMLEAGRISYALYVLHWPIMIALAALARTTGASVDLAYAATLPVTLVVSQVACRFFDEPVRAWLARARTRPSLSRASANAMMFDPVAPLPH